jgi:hypothetical protein
MTTLAVAWFAHTWGSPGSHVVGSGGDGYGVVWYFGWFEFAVRHGLDPLFTHYVHFPAGNNLMWNPGMPLVAALVSPITATAGPVVAYNVVATVAPALAGWVSYLAFRRWTAPIPALVGALVFGFSPVMAAQSAQHPFLTFSVTVPLLLIVGDRLLVVQPAPAWRDGLWLGVLLAAQLLISEEVLTMEAIIAVPAVVVLLLINREAITGRLGHAVRGLGVAAGVAAVLSAGPLAIQFLDPERPGQLHPAGIYVSDLWSFVTPNPVTQRTISSARHLAAHFTGNWTEWGSYLGFPLVVFLVLTMVLCRRRRVAWVALAVTLAAAVFSLGGSLHVAGRDTHIALPWAALSGFPVLEDLLPTRFAVVMFIGVGLLVALGLQEVVRHGWGLRVGAYGLAGLVLASLVPIVPYPATTVPALDATALRHICPAHAGSDVALMPYNQEYVVLWQAEAHYCFTIPSRSSLTGVVGGPVAVLQQGARQAGYGLPMPVRTQALLAQARSELKRWQTTAVVLGPAGPPARPRAEIRLIRWLTRLLGPSSAIYGDIRVWPHPHVVAVASP